MKYIIYESALTSSIESPKSNGDVVEFITVLQEADVKNRNGRIYPKTVIEEGLKGPMIQEKLAKHSLFGEAGHPYSQEVSRQTQVDLRNAAFMIEDFWWEGNLLKAKCKTLDTALGRDMAGLIKEGCELSFSMRGQGNVARDPYRDALVVKSPLMIITYDWVYLPSHDKAYMESICEETKESMFNTKAYNNMATALNESYNLYENGSLVALTDNNKVEKPMKDYYSNYRKSFKLLEESYQYDPNDKIKEMTNTYVILENDNEFKKVAKEDYLLKNIRSEMKANALNEGFLFHFLHRNKNKFSASDVTITKLIDTYLSKNTSVINKTRLLEAEIRSMAREDETCNDIVDNLEYEVDTPKQNIDRIRNLLGRFESRMDTIITKVLHDNKDMRTMHEDSDVMDDALKAELIQFLSEELSDDVLDEEILNEGKILNKIRWKLALFSLRFLTKKSLTDFLMAYYSDKDGNPTEKSKEWETKSKKEKYKKVRELADSLPEDVKNRVIASNAAKQAERAAVKNGVVAAVAGVSAGVSYGLSQKAKADAAAAAEDAKAADGKVEGSTEAESTGTSTGVTQATTIGTGATEYPDGHITGEVYEDPYQYNSETHQHELKPMGPDGVTPNEKGWNGTKVDGVDVAYGTPQFLDGKKWSWNEIQNGNMKDAIRKGTGLSDSELSNYNVVASVVDTKHGQKWTYSLTPKELKSTMTGTSTGTYSGTVTGSSEGKFSGHMNSGGSAILTLASSVLTTLAGVLFGAMWASIIVAGVSTARGLRSLHKANTIRRDEVLDYLKNNKEKDPLTINENFYKYYIWEDPVLNESILTEDSSLSAKDKRKWALAKKSIKYLKEEHLNKFLVDFFDDESWKQKTKDAKVQKIHDIMNRVSPEIKEQILHNKKLVEADQKLSEKVLNNSSAAVGGTGVVIGTSLMTAGGMDPYGEDLISGGAITFCIGAGLAILGILASSVIRFKNSVKNSKIRDAGMSSALEKDKDNIKKKLKNLDDIENDKKLRESVCDIAATDNFAGRVTIPVKPENMRTELPKNAGLQKFTPDQVIGSDVKPIDVINTFKESMPEDPNALAKTLEDNGLDHDGVSVPTNEVPVIKKELTDEEKSDLKEEFNYFYNIISEETDLTSESDIMKRALSYRQYMSEECANLFIMLSKKGEN